jgi:hypothetical protein
VRYWLAALVVFAVFATAAGCGTFGANETPSPAPEAGVADADLEDAIADAGALDARRDADGAACHALRFAGAQWLDVLDPDTANTKVLTIEAWVRADSHTGTEGDIVSHGPPGGGSLAGYEWSVVGATSRLKLTISNGIGTANAGGMNDTQSVPPGQFTHVALTFDGPGTKIVLYVAGQPVTTDLNAYVMIKDAAGVLRIGASAADGTTLGFRGAIDELRISSAIKYTGPFTPRALTAQSDTIALWLFEEAVGDTVEDKSGNGHTATLAGGLNRPEWIPTPCMAP